ncbi:SDR family oxidoreductase [Luteimonas sp. SX5]|uniref:SDR family oxidoreductase n=1 Tax=Luteimonas galliterrae TaxID=2940486 RepID=A0ABT0MIP4_9GAMM|nr:SDR family oxidoreductase [Luteimonas galliterrae]MCL1634725.1 SDR family oxidoreductase [Luteimonas galliterrae]
MASSNEMSGKVVVVTGGFGVLGQAAAAAAQAAGARVASIDRGPRPPGLPDAGLSLPDVDLSDFAAAEKAFAQIGEAFGRVDALFNIAGAFEWHTVADAGSDVWENLFRANVLTAVGASKAALPLMPAGGAIVNIAAAAASARAAKGMAPYTAAKSGVLRFTESLAEELKPRGIRVNSVSPTTIDTPRNRADMPDADTRGWIPPAELAKVLLYLVSGDAKPVTGANLRVGS